MKPSIEFYEVVGEFIKHFFGKAPRLHQQRYYKKQFKKPDGTALPQFTYYPIEGGITDKLLIEHFYLTPIDKNFYYTGSIGVSPNYEDGARFVCFDLDSVKEINLYEAKILPLLKQYDIYEMIEHGGDIIDDLFTRQHRWIPLRGSHSEVKLLFEQIIDEAELTTKDFDDEIFGVTKLNEKIRLFLGPHLSRNNTKFPVEIDGEYVSDPVVAIKYYLSLPYLSGEEVTKRIKDSFRKKKEIKIIDLKKFKHKSKEFTFVDRNLPLPFKCPEKIEKIASNCQAINTLLFNIRDKGWIARAGTIYHNTGLHIQRLGAYNDAKVSRRSYKETYEGRQWFRNLLKKYRPRDPETHQWESNQDDIMDNPDRYFMSCQKWNDKFDMCEGCPFRNIIESPSAFIWGKEIIKTKIGDVVRGIETSNSPGGAGDNTT